MDRFQATDPNLQRYIIVSKAYCIFSQEVWHWKTEGRYVLLETSHLSLAGYLNKSSTVYLESSPILL